MKTSSPRTVMRHALKDWNNLYPNYGAVGAKIIVKRFDILLVGIYLDYGFSSTNAYTPTFFISNILTIPAALGLSFAERYHTPNGPETWIKVSEHAASYKEAAAQIRKQFGSFLVDENLNLTQVKNFLESVSEEDDTNMLKCLAVLSCRSTHLWIDIGGFWEIG